MNGKLTMWVLIAWLSISNTANADTTFIRTYPDQMLASPYLRLMQQEIDIPLVNDYSLSFNRSVLAVGGRLEYKKLSLALTVPVVPILNNNNTDTRILGLGARMMTKRFVLETSGRYMMGLLENDMAHRADSRLFDGRLKVIVPIFAKDYSYRSSYRLNERQIKHKGSPLVFVGGNFRHLGAENYLLIDGNFNNLRQVESWTYYQGVGYGYTFTKNYFYINSQISAGFALDYACFKYEADQATNFWTAPYPIVDIRSAIGFQNDKVGYGLTFSWQPMVVSSQRSAMSVADLSVELIAAFRIDPMPVMVKLNDWADKFL